MPIICLRRRSSFERTRRPPTWTTRPDAFLTDGNRYAKLEKEWQKSKTGRRHVASRASSRAERFRRGRPEPPSMTPARVSCQ